MRWTYLWSVLIRIYILINLIMSRIGKLPVVLPESVEAKLNWNVLEVKGKLGTLTLEIHELVSIKIEESSIVVIPNDSEDAFSKALWGTTRANINNMVMWVSEGFKKSLEINGVWYKFELKGNDLVLSVGFSHKVDMKTPEGIKVAVDEKKNNIIHLTSIDKQLLGQYTAKIRAVKPPEPYKGKGIKYVGEFIRRKAWKTAK